MNRSVCSTELQLRNRLFSGTGGRSQENHGLGFRPAFMDTDTLTVYASCFADGHPAPIHLIDGLPGVLFDEPPSSGRAATLKASVISGFVRDACFYSRDEAALDVSTSRAFARVRRNASSLPGMSTGLDRKSVV